MPCGTPGSLTSSYASSSIGGGLAGNSANGSTAGPLHHYAPYHHVHHVADGGVGAAPLCGTSSTLNSSSSSGIICGTNSPAPYSSSSPHHYSGHPSVAVAAAAAAAAAAAYHHHHHHHFTSSNTAYHPYSYNYSSNANSCNTAVGSATTNGHHPTTCSASAYAHYPASSPSALELTRRKMISRSSPVSTSWRSNSPSPWEMEGYSDKYLIIFSEFYLVGAAFESRYRFFRLIAVCILIMCVNRLKLHFNSYREKQ